MTVQSLFEDPDYIAVDKPAGLSVESGLSAHPSLEKALQEAYFKAHQSGYARRNAYLRAVHRLDRCTSGVIVLAKNKSALTALMGLFEKRAVEKWYTAAVEKAPPATEGLLEHHICRDETGKKALIYDAPRPQTQPASLRYRVIGEQGGLTLIEVQMLTGRYHQIRAQLSHIGCPVSGDVLYGGQPWEENKIRLHASKLQFVHPFTDELTVIASEPAFL